MKRVLWEPHVVLPIFQHNLQALPPGYPQCDMEIGEIFLNFPLHTELRSFAGVEITPVKSRRYEEGWYQDRNRFWERMAKDFMGLTDYPYKYLKLLIHVKVIAYGDRKYPLNPFQWSHTKLNLPGE